MDEAEFEMLLRHIGLDPADHDVDALRDAVLRLRDLLTRLEPGGPEDEALPVFDPGQPL